MRDNLSNQKKFLVKLTLFLLAMMLYILLYKIYNKYSFNYKTTTAMVSQIENKIEIEGIKFFDEYIIENIAPSNYITINCHNGERVAGNSEIAKIYTNSDDILKNEKINDIDQKIENLSEINNISTLQNTDITHVNKQIYSKLYILLNKFRKGNLTNLHKLKSDLINNLNIRLMITGQVDNFDKTIEQLQYEKNNLEKNIKSTPKSIVSPVSGYFISNLDGYENECSKNHLKNLNIDQFERLINYNIKYQNKESLGKIITDSHIFFVAFIPMKYATNMSKGDSYILQFENINEYINAKIDNIKICKNKNGGLVVFKFNIINGKIATPRKEKAKIILKKYTGIKIPKKAVKYNDDGELGVYVVNNVFMKFKRIKILYEDNENIICSANEKDLPDFLHDKERIILEGKNLNDKKRIKY